jgi:hypothetical protein
MRSDADPGAAATNAGRILSGNGRDDMSDEIHASTPAAA